MFGQKLTPRRRHSQMFSRRRRGVCSFLAALLIASGAWAQTSGVSREEIDQTRSDRFPPNQTIHEFTPEKSFWKQLFENMHGGYAVTLMGPRFLGASNETYNLYVPDVAPIQLSHSANIYFQVSPDLTVGLQQDAVQDIANDVRGENGFVRGRNFVFYDPVVTFGLPNLVKVPGWWVNHSANISIPITEYSINIGRVTAININSNWRVNTYPSPWNYGFDINLNPEFFTQPFPYTYASSRKTFYASVGSYLAYQVSPQVTLSNTTTFDFNHRELADEGVFNFSSGLADRTRFNLVVSPNVYPMYLSFTGYIQALVFDLRPETTITGLALSIGW